MDAGCTEHVLLVDGGEVLPLHFGVFFHQARPAVVGGGVEVMLDRQGSPRNGGCHP